MSAAAGSVMAGGHPGPPTPVPAVPDVYAVVYVHAPDAESVHTEPVQFPAAPVDSVVPTTPPGFRAGGWRIGEWRASWSPAEHAAAVEAAREAIARGDIYQVNVVGHASAPYAGDPLPALRRVAALPGARYGGVLTGPGWALACASPETLVEIRGGRVVTRPIKGTRPATPEGRRELLASAKERAEHVMIVDLERNDLARLPGVGPVTVDELFAVRRWSNLWQAESVVSAPLLGAPAGSVVSAPLSGAPAGPDVSAPRPGAPCGSGFSAPPAEPGVPAGPGVSVSLPGASDARHSHAAGRAPSLDLVDVLRAMCPGGSVTGAPKLAALAEIARLEPVGRGASMGALGWIGPDHVDLGITIRTVAADGDRLHVWAGGGIVWDSDPAAEVAEAAAKAAPIKAALS